MNAPNVQGPVVEILTLDIKPGRRDEFHHLYVNEALPLLRKWNFQILAHGPSIAVLPFENLSDNTSGTRLPLRCPNMKTGPMYFLAG